MLPHKSSGSVIFHPLSHRSGRVHLIFRHCFLLSLLRQWLRREQGRLWPRCRPRWRLHYAGVIRVRAAACQVWAAICIFITLVPSLHNMSLTPGGTCGAPPPPVPLLPRERAPSAGRRGYSWGPPRGLGHLAFWSGKWKKGLEMVMWTFHQERVIDSC